MKRLVRFDPAFLPDDTVSIRYDDWSKLVGGTVQVRRYGVVIQTGTVDMASADSTVIWIRAEDNTRVSYTKVEGYEVWISPRQLQSRRAPRPTLSA